MKAAGVLAALLLTLTGEAAAGAQAPSPIEANAAASGGQVLVMLRTPPPHVRPNADYGGGYGDTAGRAARQRIAARLAKAHGAALVSEWPMPLIGVDCYVLAAPAGQSPETLARRLAQSPEVAWSEPVHLYRAQGGVVVTPAAAPNDPLYRAQPTVAEWRLADLHRMATGRNVRVAVIDSAIERGHPDLAGQVELSENFVAGRPEVAEQHGTGVAGIIAARSGNGLGISGVAPRARLLGLRACWQDGAGAASTVCDSLSLAKALYFAIGHNVQVINLSLSGPPDLLLGRLIDLALARGTVVVGAFDRDVAGGGFPGSHPGVVAVIDEGPGARPAGVLSAPGRDVPTTQVGGRWSLVSGSSYAAAEVSGLFALMRERRGGSIKVSALVVGGPGDKIDACATLLKLSPACDCGCPR